MTKNPEKKKRKGNLTIQDSDPAGSRHSVTAGVTLVEAFIRLGNVVDGHVTCGFGPNEEAIFIETSRQVGRGWSCFAAQSDIFPLRHRENRTLQDHFTTSTQT